MFIVTTSYSTTLYLDIPTEYLNHQISKLRINLPKLIIASIEYSNRYWEVADYGVFLKSKLKGYAFYRRVIVPIGIEHDLYQIPLSLVYQLSEYLYIFLHDLKTEIVERGYNIGYDQLIDIMSIFYDQHFYGSEISIAGTIKLTFDKLRLPSPSYNDRNYFNNIIIEKPIH